MNKNTVAYVLSYCLLLTSCPSWLIAAESPPKSPIESRINKATTAFKEFRERITRHAKIPPREVRFLWQWGLKKIKRQPTTKEDDSRAKKIMAVSSGLTIFVLLAIIAAITGYGMWKKKHYTIRIKDPKKTDGAEFTEVDAATIPGLRDLPLEEQKQWVPILENMAIEPEDYTQHIEYRAASNLFEAIKNFDEKYNKEADPHTKNNREARESFLAMVHELGLDKLRKEGNTYLHIAVGDLKHIPMIRYLISRNPEDLYKKNIHGQTPLNFFYAMTPNKDRNSNLNLTIAHLLKRATDVNEATADYSLEKMAAELTQAQEKNVKTITERTREKRMAEVKKETGALVEKNRPLLQKAIAQDKRKQELDKALGVDQSFDLSTLGRTTTGK